MPRRFLSGAGPATAPNLLLSPRRPPPPRPPTSPTRSCGRQLSPHHQQQTLPRVPGPTDRHILSIWANHPDRATHVRPVSSHRPPLGSCKSVSTGAFGPRLSHLGNGCNLLLFWDCLWPADLHVYSPAGFSRWRCHHAELSMLRSNEAALSATTHPSSIGMPK